MSENLDRVKGYLLDLDLTIVAENEAEELVVVGRRGQRHKAACHRLRAADRGARATELPRCPAEPGDLFVRLLQMNNTLVHGAFVLDETGGRIFFRDTLQIQQPRHQRAGGLDPVALPGAWRSTAPSCSPI